MAQAGLRRTLATGGLATLCMLAAACATPAGAGPDAQTRAVSSLPPLRLVPGSLLLPPPAARGRLPDTCGASALASLVGRLRTEIPVPVDLSRRRVACTACPVAPDVRLDRVNILYDAATGRVTKITCG